MSASDGDDDRPRREVAWRVFAAEFDDADYEFAESEEERAPNYVVTPTGARVNRLFAVGVLTTVEGVNDDVVRARVVDPTGAFVVYAGQYQPDALAALENAEVPSFVAVTGKANTFSPEDADRVYTSIRPESVNEVTAATRDRWVVTTAEQTLSRIDAFADALGMTERGEELTAALAERGASRGLASGVAHAVDHYGTTPAYLAAVRELALDATRVVAGDREEVETLALAPGEGDGTDADLSFDGDLADVEPAATGEAGETSAEPAADAATSATSEPEPADESAANSEPEPTPESEPEPGLESETEPESTSGVEPTPLAGDAEPAAESEPSAGGESDAVEDEEWEMDEETREQVEEEFDVGFSTGEEIPDAGETDLSAEPVADADPGEAASADAGHEGDDAGGGERDEDDIGAFKSSGGFEDELTDDDDASADDDGLTEDDESVEDEDLSGFTEDEYDEPASDVEDAESAPSDLDIEDIVVDYMDVLDDGNGADRDELVRTVMEETDADESTIEDAIQSALMGGRCYEAGDDRLKAI